MVAAGAGFSCSSFTHFSLPMTTTPIVALQKPKEISLDEIETELSQIWHFQNGDKEDTGAVRATTFSMVVYEPEDDKSRRL
jgi:hypothetical protein